MSSTANKDHYYGPSIAKSRRGSPGDPQAIPTYFQSGQGSYPNAYTAPRSSPGRYDLTNVALSTFNTSPQWNPANTNPFPNYDMTTNSDRYASQHTYAYPRQTPPLSPTEQRRLPPLTTSSSPGPDRWQQPPFVPAVPGYAASTTANGIRAPTASYTSAYYPAGQEDTYGYMSHDPLSPMGSHTTPGPYDDHLNSSLRLQPRPTSPPYGSSRSAHTTPHLSGHHYNTPPPVSPTSPDEPTIKKKRKRADAAQLKVLNETYARTAFPSTEERHALAKALDMSARSVQIWFQNKRQSMRQTNRQSNNAASSSHPAYPSQSERLMEESMSHGHGHPHSSNFPPSQITLTEATYLQGPGGQDLSRPLISQSSSSHRRFRSPEEPDSRFRNY